MPVTNTLETLRPGPGVRREDGASHRFIAEGDDPQMLWLPTREQEAQFVGRSAVRIVLNVRVLDGRLLEPCVFMDWGDGFSEDTWKPLLQVEPGLYAATAHSNAGACRRIRLDPSRGPCRFEIDAFSVAPSGAPSPAMHRIGPVWRGARRVLRRLPKVTQNRLRAVVGVITGRDAPRLGAEGGGPERWREAYDHGFEVARGVRSPQFAAPPLEPPARDPEAARVIAFYLPQYHPIPENDAWWGRGFTEWTNVTKATPQFAGHLQPKLPADLGYYDFRTPDTLHAQADLARRTGVDAFCFHYYWFAGRRLLERPLDAFVADPAIDLPFCLCWANENWTRRWDGDEQDVLIGQRHSPEDDDAVFDDLARYLRAPRYLRVGGRPLVLIYRPDVLPDGPATVARWRARARGGGLGEIFLLCTNAFGFCDHDGYGFDGIIDFPPHALSSGEITTRVHRLNPEYAGRVYDYPAMVDDRLVDLAERQDRRHHPGVMPAWDNEARKPGAGHVFHNADPRSFLPWMQAALDCAERLRPTAERLVFVNAWNEWAEGACLEPDRWFGHGFAQAVRAALESRAPRIPSDEPGLAPEARPRRAALVIAHVYYADLIADMSAPIAARADVADVLVTFPDVWSREALAQLRSALPTAHLLPTRNVGRDVAPFIRALAWAEDHGYGLFCKVHSKRSPHLADGDERRERTLSTLLRADVVHAMVEAFASDPELGLAAAAAEQMRLGDPGVLWNNRAAMDVLAARLGFSYGDETPFVAGTMFWGRVAAFKRLVAHSADLEFEPELGRIDGTLAHALERAMGALVIQAGYGLRWLD